MVWHGRLPSGLGMKKPACAWRKRARVPAFVSLRESKAPLTSPKHLPEAYSPGRRVCNGYDDAAASNGTSAASAALSGGDRN